MKYTGSRLSTFADLWGQLEQRFQCWRVQREFEQPSFQLEQQHRLPLRSTLKCQKFCTHGCSSSTEGIKESVSAPARQGGEKCLCGRSGMFCRRMGDKCCHGTKPTSEAASSHSESRYTEKERMKR